jgi:oligopeptide transport system ATP-binding protein
MEKINYPYTCGDASDKQTVLSVRDLAISFRTEQGYVHAVRNVSFDLYKEETLCIVGESGSGKSVTNKTIMGILPKNAHIDSGSIIYEGEDLTKISEDEFHNIRGNKIGMIFQDPLSSLNPIMKIGKQITEEMIINGDHLKRYYDSLISKEFIAYKNDLRLRQLLIAEHKRKKKAKMEVNEADFSEKKRDISARIASDKAALSLKKKEARWLVKEKRKDIYGRHFSKVKEIFKGKGSLKEKYDAFLLEHRRALSEIRVTHKEAKERALSIMKEVGIPNPERRFYQYPFEFSGGMRQRIVIAIALTAEPDVLICDEPTTALDVTIQAQILELINRLKASHHMSVIFITHDLGVVANMADRVAVMYAGKIVEYGKASEVFYSPAHPYTWALLSSIPDVDSKERLEAIPGTPPNMLYPPKGDAFALRSKYALGADFKEEPPMWKLSSTHYAATWLLDERAPKAEMPSIVATRIANSLKKQEEDKKEGKI